MKVITAITGDKNYIRDKQCTEGAEFIAFTNQESTVWKVRKPYDLFKDPNRNAKIHKVLIHKFIDTDISLWMDGNYALQVPLKKLVDNWLEGYDMTLFNHPGRDCVYTEVSKCLELKKEGPLRLNEKIISIENSV